MAFSNTHSEPLRVCGGSSPSLARIVAPHARHKARQVPSTRDDRATNGSVSNEDQAQASARTGHRHHRGDERHRTRHGDSRRRSAVRRSCSMRAPKKICRPWRRRSTRSVGRSRTPRAMWPISRVVRRLAQTAIHEFGRIDTLGQQRRRVDLRVARGSLARSTRGACSTRTTGEWCTAASSHSSI